MQTFSFYIPKKVLFNILQEVYDAIIQLGRQAILVDWKVIEMLMKDVQY